MKSTDKTERNNEILKRYDEGVSMTIIGCEFGITRQRVEAIVKARRVVKRQRYSDIRTTIQKDRANGSRIKEIAELYNTSQDTIRKIVGSTRLPERQCLRCGKKFTPKSTRNVFCCATHRNTYNHYLWLYKKRQKLRDLEIKEKQS